MAMGLQLHEIHRISCGCKPHLLLLSRSCKNWEVGAPVSPPTSQLPRCKLRIHLRTRGRRHIGGNIHAGTFAVLRTQHLVECLHIGFGAGGNNIRINATSTEEPTP